MNQLSNFNTLFEMAFGLNALLFFFELTPWFEQHATRLSEQHKKLADEKIEVTGNSELYPIGFLVGAMYHSFKTLFRYAFIFNSALILALLVYSAFSPQAEIGTKISVFLLFLFFGVPLLAIIFVKRMISLMQRNNELVEEQIRKTKYPDFYEAIARHATTTGRGKKVEPQSTTEIRQPAPCNPASKN